MLPNRLSRRKAVFMGLLIALLTGHSPVLAESPWVIEVGLFSVEKTSSTLPDGWEPFRFKNIERHTGDRYGVFLTYCGYW